MKKEIIKPAIALFVICLISAILLALTNSITNEKIKQNAVEDAAKSRKIVFADAESFSEEMTENDIKYVEAYDGSNNIIGYVFTAESKGYGGTVSVMTAIKSDGTVLKSVVLAMDDETPGLGQNASKADFIDQFSGKTGHFVWSKTNSSDTEIKGVTSASFTSKGVIECVNNSIDAFNSLGGAGK